MPTTGRLRRVPAIEPSASASPKLWTAPSRVASQYPPPLRAMSVIGDEATLRAVLADELRSLAATPAGEVETAFLIHPRALADFLDAWEAEHGSLTAAELAKAAAELALPTPATSEPAT